MPPKVRPGKRQRSDSSAFQKRVQKKHEAAAEAELAAAAEVQAADDAVLLQAKHSLKAVRRLAGGSKFGDIAATVAKYGVNRTQLRTAMEQPGDVLRPKRGRPFTLHSAVEEVIADEAETRAGKNRAMSMQDVGVHMAAAAAAGSGGEGFADTLPSETTVRQFLHRRGLLVRRERPT
jgi:hypothetical protein